MKTKMKIGITVFIAIILALAVLVITMSGIKRTENKPINDVKDMEPKIQEPKYEELENIPYDYDFVKMVEDKCYIVMNSGPVYNAMQMENFLKNVKNNIPDEVRIIQYTIEGEPVITDLKYTKDKFIIKDDSRRDHWSAENDRIITTKEYDTSKFMLTMDGKELTQIDNKLFEKNNEDNRKSYQINLVSKEEKLDIYICNYVKIDRKQARFQLIFNRSNDQKVAILKKGEDEKYDYNIYSYCGTVDIVIDGTKMSLRDALISNKITMSEIFDKAEKDYADKIIYTALYLDGGSKDYVYDDYSIIKLNKLDGNRDCYIGKTSMTTNELL